MTTINTNVASINAQRNLSASQGSLATSMQRLSSGLRVNSAKDDAAGLAISERMNSQVKGMNVAIRNANDGISLAQTAEGALGKVGDMLQRVRELAVQSANATNSDSDRASLQAEANQLKLEIQRVSEQTKFNGTSLLDGNFSNKAFQVGANQGETISIDSIANTQISALGNWTSIASTTPAVAGASSSGGLSSLDFSVEAVEAQDGVEATAGRVTTAAAFPTAFDADNLVFSVDGTDVTLDQDYENTAAVVTAIGDQLGDDYEVSADDDGVITIAKAVPGEDSSAPVIDVTSTGANPFEDATSAPGTDAVAAIDAAPASALAFSVDGNDITLTGNYSGDGGRAQMVSDIQDALETAAAGAYVVSANTDNNGFTIRSATAGAEPPVVLSFSEGTSITAADGTPVAGQTIATAANAITVDAVDQTGFADLDISTVTGANNAILAMDAAISAVNDSRGNLGAIQSRFENAIGTLQVTSENLSSARGRIVDADFAKETSNLSRAQILQQAGTAMVAQANQLPQGVLSLLR